MTFSIGDRVLCHKPIDRNRSTVGLTGTVIDYLHDRYRTGKTVPVIEFDRPITNGHAGGDRGSANGKPGHCWNAWGWREGDGSLSLLEEDLLTQKERTQKAVLAKIKYLDQKFEQRQKEKKNARARATIQTGVEVGQSISNLVRGYSVSRGEWYSSTESRVPPSRW